MRGRAYRRYKAFTKQRRRMKEKLNMLPSNFLDFAKRGYWEKLKEQPQVCSGMCCGNQRKYCGPTMQERRASNV